MGADLFESYVGSLISALTLGLVFYQEAGIVFPLVLSACGIIAAIIGSLLVKSIGNSDPHKALKQASTAQPLGSGLLPYPQPHILRQFHGCLYHHYRFIGRRADWSCH